MKCANCGAERPSGKFCPECGSQEIEQEKAATDIKCAKCGRIRKRGKFCPECGSSEIYVEPQVMVCSDCGTVRKSGKFCSECGSTNIILKPASLFEGKDVQSPIYKPDNITINETPDLNKAIEPDINITDDYESEDVFESIEDEEAITEHTDSVVDIEIDEENESVDAIVEIKKESDQETPKPDLDKNDSVQEKISKSENTLKNNSEKPISDTGYNAFNQSYSGVNVSSGIYNPYNNAGSFQNNNSNINNNSNAGISYNSTDNSYYNGYSQQPYYTAPPRPRKANPALATPTGEKVRKCKIIIIVLAVIEFIAMFLPATHYGVGRYSESLSVSDGNGFVIFIGFTILAILVILAGFSHYFGAALGLLIQSLILSIASFFIVALVNEEGQIATKGIAYYIFLFVPILIIIISIADLVFSIQLKNESRK